MPMHSGDRLSFLGVPDNSACNVLSLCLHWGRVWILVILPVKIFTFLSHRLYFYTVDAVPLGPETSHFCYSSIFLPSLILDYLTSFFLFTSFDMCWIPFANKSQLHYNILLILSLFFSGLPISHVEFQEN